MRIKIIKKNCNCLFEKIKTMQNITVIGWCSRVIIDHSTLKPISDLDCATTT
jgi:hypothetical protein